MERSIKNRTMNVKKNDVVVVISGADKGKKGKVLEAIPSEGRVIVEKVNIVKRHQRPTQQQRQGGIIEKEAKIDASNVQPFCTKCEKPVRIGHKKLEDGKKVRICRKCGEMMDLG
ncbi:MAG: 50S ribosomal protein L24 [Nitrospinota bacterium]|nr:50S ribosomal protein L24 [Nitrospinota bacterium]MDH5678071.1 50S ribosomal protein L24 [Nitrospinota bacterium]MDH5755551.1 50S ribosomal protein L24 [Nitrospinota bacterium]